MRLTHLSVAALLVAACQPAPMTGLTEAQTAEIEASALEASRTWTEAYVAQESVDDYMRFVSDWAVAPFSGAASLDATRQTLEREWARTDWLSHEIRDHEAMALGPDAAMVRLVVVGTVADTLGATERWTQNVAYVLHRQNSEWKAIVARVNNIRQPMEQE